MSYSVRTLGGAVTSGLSSSTSCILWNASLAARVAGFSSVTNSGAIFEFKTRNRTIAESLVTTTLASTVVGAQILFDSGGGIWQLGTVSSDGASASANDGSVLDSSLRAAAFASGNFQAAPPNDARLRLIGAGGSYSFFVASAPAVIVGEQFVGGPLSTVGGLSSSSPVVAFVEVGGAWQVASF